MRRRILPYYNPSVPAFYRNSVAGFLNDSTDSIIGQLTNVTSQGIAELSAIQLDSWRNQVRVLKDALREQSAAEWKVLLEYPIPRRGKRIDCVLLAGSTILVLEFKCGEDKYERGAIAQTEDYCLDLSDFHNASEGRTIVPILVATEAPFTTIPRISSADQVKPIWLANKVDLAEKLVTVQHRYQSPGAPPIDLESWDRSEYHPTPTIIESARALYAGQNVREISRCQAGATNLTATSDAVIDAIENARTCREKLICFITGVPGSGKTLAGLNIVHNHSMHDGDLGVFLSGNGPLVRVLTEALARDHADKAKVPKETARRKVSTFVQNVHRFIDHYYAATEEIPPDRVVIFDEAQRAWDARQSLRKFKRPFSEPELMLQIMDRHPEWAVIVALIGTGQEINSGEAGLSEWGRTLLNGYRHWKVMVSPELHLQNVESSDGLFSKSPAGLTINCNSDLHLKVALRSYRAEALSQFVDDVLSMRPDPARGLMAQLAKFPVRLTRDQTAMKTWLRKYQRGTRRIGLVASSGGRRLKAVGYDVQAELPVEDWFLNPADDVRSSFYLESPATEFGIQGLELDWVGLSWELDLVPSANGWIYRAFRGTQWQSIHDPVRRRYTLNKYRVLLTRAREGMIIWVPQGDPDDPTRPPALYNAIAEYLEACGIPLLDD